MTISPALAAFIGALLGGFIAGLWAFHVGHTAGISRTLQDLSREGVWPPHKIVPPWPLQDPPPPPKKGPR